MAITEAQVTIWASELQSSLKKTLVFAGPKAVNRNYQGDIQGAGNSVRIISISRPTVATYTPDSTSISFETLTDAERTLLIDQSKYFAFELDDVVTAQTALGKKLLTEAAQEAAYALGDTADQFVAALYTEAATANEIGTRSITSTALAVTGLIDLAVKLDTSNVPRQSRYAIIPPWYHGLLMGSDLFARVDASGSSETLRNGIVGRAFGFDVYVSNNVINTTGDDYLVSAGYTGAITYAEQINKVESLRPESAFSDAIKGLHLYGAKLVRPTGIATMEASIT